MRGGTRSPLASQQERTLKAMPYQTGGNCQRFSLRSRDWKSRKREKRATTKGKQTFQEWIADLKEKANAKERVHLPAEETVSHAGKGSR